MECFFTVNILSVNWVLCILEKFKISYIGVPGVGEMNSSLQYQKVLNLKLVWTMNNHEFYFLHSILQTRENSDEQ